MDHRAPIPGAPNGKVSRNCAHTGAFTLVRAFDGVSIYQCLTCRKIAEVETRTGKTCLNCGAPLKGRQQNWCSSDCGAEFANSKNRGWWADTVKQRDNHTCQRCGWHPTPEGKQAYWDALKVINTREYKKPWDKRMTSAQIEYEARKVSGWRELEAHHITPLEWGGPEFDLANGVCLCDRPCHDDTHRELNAQVKKVGS